MAFVKACLAFAHVLTPNQHYTLHTTHYTLHTKHYTLHTHDTVGGRVCGSEFGV